MREPHAAPPGLRAAADPHRNPPAGILERLHTHPRRSRIGLREKVEQQVEPLVHLLTTRALRVPQRVDARTAVAGVTQPHPEHHTSAGQVAQGERLASEFDRFAGEQPGDTGAERDRAGRPATAASTSHGS